MRLRRRNSVPYRSMRAMRIFACACLPLAMSASNGRAVLVTGASRGIGAAVARAFRRAATGLAFISDTAAAGLSRLRRRWTAAGIASLAPTSPTRRRSG